jgi:hypothetical protein
MSYISSVWELSALPFRPIVMSATEIHHLTQKPDQPALEKPDENIYYPLRSIETLKNTLLRVLINKEIDKREFGSLSTNEKSILLTYLGYVLKPEATQKLCSGTLSAIILSDDDFCDLTKRKDETLKKVFSTSLKMIYKDFIWRHAINKNLNPRKYVKREEINRRLFFEYFGREPQPTKRNQGRFYEHNALFFIKEGVTDEWFESIIGIRHLGLPKVPSTKLLEEILSTLYSENLVEAYKLKIESMLEKLFDCSEERKIGMDFETQLQTVKNRLEFTSKKPKIALAIPQFRQAIKLSLSTLKKIIGKYNIRVLVKECKVRSLFSSATSELSTVEENDGEDFLLSDK